MALITTINKSDEWNESAKMLTLNVQTFRDCALHQLVQSLNSPFFPLLTGAEPGRAKRESRITCMRMLRTNQLKITRSQPYYAARVNVSLNAFFSSRSEFCLTLILWQKTNRNVVYRGLYSYRQRVRVITLFPNIFCTVSACWAASLRKFLKGKSDSYK